MHQKDELCRRRRMASVQCRRRRRRRLLACVWGVKRECVRLPVCLSGVFPRPADAALVPFRLLRKMMKQDGCGAQLHALHSARSVESLQCTCIMGGT